MKKIKGAFICNAVLFVLELFANLWMMSGIKIAGTTSSLSSARWGMFRYFTVDSNVIMGIFAAIIAWDLWRVLKGQKQEVSRVSYVLMLTGTVGVTLTMLVTIFFLAPTATYNWLSLFTNSNFFLHLLNPLVSIIALVVFERSNRLKFKDTLYGMIPMVIYACYYMGAAIVNSENGVVKPGYDWYGFLKMGLGSAVFILPILIGVTYGISVVLWKLSRTSAK